MSPSHRTHCVPSSILCALIYAIKERRPVRIALLRQSSQQLKMYKEFWEHAGEAFLLVHHESEQILDANPLACAMYGYRREDMLKKKITDLSESPQCTRAGMDERATFIPLRWHIRRGGMKFPIEAKISYFNDQGYTVCAVIIKELPLPKEIIDEVV